MTLILPFAALIIGTIIGAVLMAMVAGGQAEDAYRRGRLDERTSTEREKESA